MSSPASRRSNRNSATPRRTPRSSQAPATSPDNQLMSEASHAPQSPQSSRAGSQNQSNTPRGQLSTKNVPSSSPMRFGSSAKSVRSGSAISGDVSSPLRQHSNASDGDRTPRANRAPAGGRGKPSRLRDLSVF
jgi:DNA replication licensing factor MCM4